MFEEEGTSDGMPEPTVDVRGSRRTGTNANRKHARGARGARFKPPAKIPARNLKQSVKFADHLNMRVDKAVVAIRDLKEIEQFLMDLPHVADASVWISKGRLLAHVTVPAWAPVVSNTIRAACLKELGEYQTPDEVYLIADQALVA